MGTVAEELTVNMNGRIYDPHLGRFLSVDPVYDRMYQTQGINGYSYVRNNPVSYTDPTGLAGDGPVNSTPIQLPNFYVHGWNNWDFTRQFGQPGAGLLTSSGVAMPWTPRSNAATINQSFQNGGLTSTNPAAPGGVNTDPVTPEETTVPNVIEDDGWSLRGVYKTLEGTRTQEAQVFVDQLKQMTIVRFDEIDVRSTYSNGKSEIVHYPHEDAKGGTSILAGGAVKKPDRIYIYRNLTQLAAIETMYHEGMMHNTRGAGEYDARAGAALFMERVGLGTQFPQFLKKTQAPAASPKAAPPPPTVTANPEGIRSSIGQIYQTQTSVEKVYGAKVLQQAPQTGR